MTEESSLNNRHHSADIILGNFISNVEVNKEVNITNLPQDSFVIIPIY